MRPGLLARLFPVEEINGGGRCPTYLYRRVLLRIGSKRSRMDFALYLHHFVGDDWSLDLHDHPKRFISIGLWGRYIEHQPGGRRREWRAPWIRSFPAQHVHRITLAPGETCWTLVFVFRTVREWGFWHPVPGERPRWIHWRHYVRGPEADRRKACP